MFRIDDNNISLNLTFFFEEFKEAMFFIKSNDCPSRTRQYKFPLSSRGTNLSG